MRRREQAKAAISRLWPGSTARVSFIAVAAALAAALIVWAPGAPPVAAAPIGTVTNPGRVLAAPVGITRTPFGNTMWVINGRDNSIVEVSDNGSTPHRYTGSAIDGPTSITTGPDGALWFTNYWSNSIGRIDPVGLLSSFPGNGLINRPMAITAGPDGNLWFINQDADSIGRITLGGVVSAFTDPSIVGPRAITAGPDGNLWFTNEDGNSIGQITPSGVVVTFTDPAIESPTGITAGADGNLWFTNSTPFAGSISRITPTGVVTDFAVVDAPTAITTGGDGNVWFIVSGDNTIGRMTPAGVLTTFPSMGSTDMGAIATANDGKVWFTSSANDWVASVQPNGAVRIVTGRNVHRPYGIALGPDGAMWFANSNGASIGRVTASGATTSYTAAGVVRPYGITSGPDGNLWFTDYDGNAIGRITPAGVITVFAGDPAVDHPHGIAPGPDGALWFTNAFGNSIGRITTSGVITTFTGLGISSPQQITAGPDGALWFANRANASIGRITVAGVVTNFTDPSINGPYGIAAGPDGNLWFTNNYGGSIGRITPAGTVANFTAPWVAGVGGPYDIASGPDGNLWFTVYGSTSIGRVTPAGVLTPFADEYMVKSPYGIAAGGDGAMWFTNHGNYSIGRIVAADVPAAPTSVSGVAGNGQVAVSWSAPVDDGGSSISGYTVTSSPGSQTCSTAGTLTCTVTGLTNGTAYTFTVTATNDVGTGPASTPSAAVTPAAPTTAPGTPTGVTGVGGNAEVAVSWSAPVDDGGSSISGYTVTSSPGSQTCSTAGTLTCTVTGLTNGTAYTFTVTATNDVGTGPASTPSAAVTPAAPTTAPGAPTGVGGVRGNAEVAVSWSAPADDGGSSISGYTVTSSPGSHTCVTAGTLTCTVTGLTNGTAYTFTVTATNDVGTGPASAPSAAVTPGAAPGAPTGVGGVRGNAEVAVSWSAPADDGGSSISGYTVTSSPGSHTCVTAGTLTCTVTGLTNGTAYTFTVTATNDVGTGPASAASAPVTPIAVPGAPTGVSAVAGKQRATVSWTAPGTTGGSPITGYTVTSSPGAKVCTTSGALTCAVTGLTAATSYTFTVRAENDGGLGVPSAPSSSVVPWDGSGYHAVTPERILDSRLLNVGFAGPVTSTAFKTLQVTGLGGPSNVPATATAVVMNVTVADATNESFLTVFPTNTNKPVASNLNFGAGQIIPNLVTVKLGTGGKVDFANAVGSTNVIADVVGYYDDGTVAGDRFNPVTPVRLLDSRTTTGNWAGPLPAGAPRDLFVRQGANPNGVPATATAVVANVTVTGGTAQSFVSVWPSGENQPGVSNLNLLPGQTIPNLVTVKIGGNGAIKIANAVGSVQVIVDVVGYFDPTGGSRFHPINPNRVLDTRTGKGLSGPQGPAQTRSLAVAGGAGTSVPAGATGLVANVTVADATNESFVSVFPGNVSRPNPFSNLNFGANQVIPNLTAVGIAPDGSIRLYNQVGSTAIIADAVGYYAPT